jgi:hypothetical protein
MKKDIKDVCGEYLRHLSFDVKLLMEFKKYRLNWAQKNSSHIEFLGSNLTGVHNIRYSSVDEDMLFIDILNVDQNKLRNDLYLVPGINKAHKVASNVTYITLVYLMHMFSQSKLKNDDKSDAIKELYYIFAYKAISSLYTNYFPYPVSESVAKMVYERLSNRYLIKKLGTWQDVLEYRTRDLLHGGIHYNRILNLNTDNATRIIADMQSRLRENIKEIYNVLVEVNASNERIYSSSMIQTDEEGESTRDITVRPDNYILYINSIIRNENDFINDDLVYLITSIVQNIDKEKFVMTLRELTKLHDYTFVETIIVTTINYMRTKNIINNYEKQTYEILTSMKGYWSSSSVKDKELIRIKKYLYDISSKATKKKTKWLLATITIGILLYIFLRALYKNKH